jgi:large subunit ribosomal protein L29
MTRPSELRDIDDDELLTRLSEARQELFNLRFQHVTGQLDNHARLGQVRKDIARMNTLLREREIAAADAEQAADDAARQAAAEARRARVEASRRGVAAGVGKEASDRQRQQAEENSDG